MFYLEHHRVGKAEKYMFLICKQYQLNSNVHEFPATELSVLYVVQPVHSNSLLAQLPRAWICHLELSYMKIHHRSGQLDLGNIAVFPELDVNKLSVSDFKVADWLRLT